MHPILFSLPFPLARLSLFGPLLALALVGLGVAAYGRWRSGSGALVFGLALTGVAAYAAIAWGEHSVAFADVSVPSWGALLGLWLLAAWQLARVSAERLGTDPASVANCLVVSGVTGLLLSRLVFVASNLSEAPDLDWLALHQGGLSGMGAVLGACAGAALFVRYARLSFWQWLDLAAPLLALGLLVVRIGCYLHGCDFGVRLDPDSPDWLKALGTFPRWTDPDQGPVFGAAAWLAQVQRGSLEPNAASALPVHPVQLYEAAAGLGLALVIHGAGSRRRFHGQLGLMALLLFSLIRFLFEALRGDDARGAFGPLLEPQVSLPLGLLIFAAAFGYGPAWSVTNARRRTLLLGLSAVPALLSWFATRGAGASAQQLSLTQWLALATALGAAYAWSRLSHTANFAEAPTKTAPEPRHSP